MSTTRLVGNRVTWDVQSPNVQTSLMQSALRSGDLQVAENTAEAPGSSHFLFFISGDFPSPKFPGRRPGDRRSLRRAALTPGRQVAHLSGKTGTLPVHPQIALERQPRGLCALTGAPAVFPSKFEIPTP